MSGTQVLHYDAFSRIPGKGNPAGIVRDAEGLQQWEMQQIAASVGFNETTFVLPSQVADVKLKYFTPGHEMDLWGTASGVMGAYALTYMEPHRDSIAFTVEQGLECGYDGRVKVEVRRTNEVQKSLKVYITGEAVFVKEMIV
ncbi:MAG: PhzF family phenazine biosynthesis isomerase [Cohnella sp.]|nr:PhzF family phenazine biosynthesis isomerase [Cohnella sp.]